MCPAAGDSDTQVNEWLAQFAPPMTARLNAGATGANLTDTDTYNLLTLCPFETVATEQRSEFCDIYEELQAEAAFAYNADLDKFYGTGYGFKLLYLRRLPNSPACVQIRPAPRPRPRRRLHQRAHRAPHRTERV